MPNADNLMILKQADFLIDRYPKFSRLACMRLLRGSTNEDHQAVPCMGFYRPLSAAALSLEARIVAVASRTPSALSEEIALED